MENKKYMIFSLLLLLVLFSSTVSAAFTRNHLYINLKAFDEVDSDITRMCGDERFRVFMDGNTAFDVPVLHYHEEDFLSYVFTHTNNGYVECLKFAGTDPDLLCQCYGGGTHIVQDMFFHNENAIVPKYLKNSKMPNFAGHMVIEQSYLDESEALWAETSDPIYTSGELDYYDSIILDTFFEDEKHVFLLDKVAGINTRNDLNIFASGYKGEGFKETVYNEKVQLPWWFFPTAYGLAIGGLALIILIWLFGRTRWKFMLMLPFLLMLIFGVIILYAYYTNSTWQVVTSMLRVPTSLGLMDVSQTDVEETNRLMLEATKQFLRTGRLPVDDASGRTYIDRFGNSIQGALGEASKAFQYQVLPVLIVVFVLWMAIFGYLTFFAGKAKKRKKK